MTQSKDIAETLIATKNIFTATLNEQTEVPEWEKEFSGLSWTRQRRYRATRVVPTLFRRVVQPQTSAMEWVGPTFVVGEAQGTVLERLSLTQLEVRERSYFSKELGKLVHKSWRLMVRSEMHEVPHITVRDLTQDEHDEHHYFGGSKAPVTTAEMEPNLDMVLGYEQAWYLREGADQSPRMDPYGQIGRIVLGDLYETSERLLLNGSA